MTMSERYELGEVLGYGGMSEVHRGLDTRLGRDVAVKVLRADLARDPQFQMRFRREAQNAAALNHPAIVAVYDTGEGQGDIGALPYIVMEYVDGQTLREIVRTQGPLTQERVLDVMADVCAALDFSHRHQIIHRDVKPANIMITRAGAVKVMDFGIARALGDSQNVTQTAAVIGTAQYLSPEQARGEAVDARSDVYAAGCVLFELLTGEPPFTGDTPVAVAYQHVREDPRSPSQVNPAVSPALDAVVLKALSKNPANRYQSAAEMRSDLVRVRSGQSPLAPAVMSADERTAMMAGPAAGATRRINGRGVAPPVTPHYDDDGYYEDEPHRGYGRVVAVVAGVLVLLGLIGFVAYQLLSGPAAPQQVQVPGVVGKTQQDATNDLVNDGLRVAATMHASSPTATGTVLSTDPPPGTAVAVRSTVNIVVGSGPIQANVPPVVGLSLADATAALKAQGLILGKTTDDPTTDATKVGTVTATVPAVGAPVKGGSAVDVSVGVKQTVVTVPDVSGQSEANATAALKAAGFTVASQDVDNSAAQGTVVSTTPSANSKVAPASAVTINVSKGSQQPPVPDVSDQTESQAKKALDAAGFDNVDTTKVDSGGQVQDGHVVSTDPPAGSSVDTDQKITLNIAKNSSGSGDNN